MKTQTSYKFSEKFWKKVQENFNIYNLLEFAPKKAEQLYELDADEMNIDLVEAKKWLDFLKINAFIMNIFSCLITNTK